MTTTISTWGNSEAIRVPKEILRKVGLSQGDVVDFAVNERGRLEIIPQLNCREGSRRKRVTFNELFHDYDGPPLHNEDPWGDETFVSAEKEAWLQ